MQNQGEPSHEASTGGGWLGVEFGSTPPNEPGILLTGIVPNSPAARAGLKTGDVVLKIDGSDVSGPSDLVRLVSSRSSGDQVAVAVLRGGKQRLFRVELIGRPERDEMLRMAFLDRPAPALRQLETVQGSPPESIGAVKGQIVVLEFWASWCPICPVLVPTMNRWHDEYSAQGVQVVGVTTEPVLVASRTAAQLDMRYPISSDHTGKTTEAYRATALPMIFVLDRSGTVRDIMVGYDSSKLEELERLIGRLAAEG